MKKLALAIMFTMLAGTAFAQGWAENNVGVYLDPEGTNNCGFGVGSIPMYLVGTGLTAETTGGFEVKLIIEGPAFGPLNPTYPVQASNLASRENEWIVGYGTPAPAPGGVCVFMSFDVFVDNDAMPTEFFIEPVYFASIPGSGAYLDGSDYNIILPLYNATGDPVTGETVPVCTLNGQCVVDSEDASWGGVKSLYR